MSDDVQSLIAAQEASRIAETNATTAKKNERIEAIKLEANDPARVLAVAYDIMDCMGDLGARFVALQESVALMQSEIRALTIASIQDRPREIKPPSDLVMSRVLAALDKLDARVAKLECPSASVTSCDHMYDQGVFCSEPSLPGKPRCEKHY